MFELNPPLTSFPVDLDIHGDDAALEGFVVDSNSSVSSLISLLVVLAFIIAMGGDGLVRLEAEVSGITLALLENPVRIESFLLV